MSSLFNTNKTVYLTLDSNGQATANISVPFPVKEIVVRQIVLTTDDRSADVQTLYAFGMLHSDLVQNNVLGYVSLYSYTQSVNQNIRYCYKNPRSIAGTYQFQLRNTIGNPYGLIGSNIYAIAVVLEFIEYQTEISNVIS